MFCPACGKEILSDTKFCPQCGKALNFTPDKASNQQKRPAHPALTTFLIGLVFLGLHIFIVGASASASAKSNSRQDITGINVGFGLFYFILFIIFLTTLFRKPKTSVTSTVQNAPPANRKDQEKKHSGTGKWVIVIILILALPALFIFGNNGLANPTIITAFVVIILGFIIWTVWRFIKKHREGCLRLFYTAAKTVKYVIHHPKLAVISVGADNDYGHPGEETMGRLTGRIGQDKIYRTDKNGTVEFITNGVRLWVKTDK